MLKRLTSGVSTRELAALASLLAFLLVVPLFVSDYLVTVLITILYFAYVGQAWNVMMGFAGQLSLGHALYVGLGAYVAAVLFVRLGLNPWLGALVAVVIAVAVAAVIGFLAFRFGVGGVYFAILTIAFAEFARIGFDHWPLVGGSAGTNVAAAGQTENALSLLSFPARPAGIFSQGWVGIGTAQPQAALDVVGSVVVEQADVLDVPGFELRERFDSHGRFVGRDQRRLAGPLERGKLGEPFVSGAGLQVRHIPREVPADPVQVAALRRMALPVAVRELPEILIADAPAQDRVRPLQGAFEHGARVVLVDLQSLRRFESIAGYVGGDALRVAPQCRGERRLQVMQRGHAPPPGSVEPLQPRQRARPARARPCPIR